MNTLKNSTRIPTVASKKLGLAVNAVFRSHPKECKTRSQHTAANKLFENEAIFRYLSTTFTNHTRIQEGILRKHSTQRKPNTTHFKTFHFSTCCLKM